MPTSWCCIGRPSLASTIDCADRWFRRHRDSVLTREPTDTRLTRTVPQSRPDRIEIYDIVDDWLAKATTAALRAGGHELGREDVLESPGFLTGHADFIEWFGRHPARMQHFYRWQHRRLGILVEGDRPVGGRWSFDTENRKKLPRGHHAPQVDAAQGHSHEVRDAIETVARDFPDAPGDPQSFAWPTDHAKAAGQLEQFLAERFADFGPYEMPSRWSIRISTTRCSPGCPTPDC